MKTKVIGVLVLVFVFAGAFAFKMIEDNKVSEVTLKGYVGGEKVGFLENPDIKKIMKKKYGITFDYSKAGSIEMVKENTEGSDFLFPSSQTAMELFKETKAKSLIKSEVAFNSPIVLYSWDIVTDALEKQGIVERINGSYYIVDMPKLVDLAVSGKKWADIGLNELYGEITVISTDPTKSNSGNMFAGLLANILNNGNVTDENTVQEVLPKLKDFFAKLGYMEHSSGDLFEQYLRTGVGAKPLVAGYENQIIEFAVAHPKEWESVKGKIRILYPVPTVWSSHPYIALSANGVEGIKALSDEEVQKIAWEKHGFRTGMMGVSNDPAILDIVGIPENIDKVVPMPKPSVMDTIIKSLE